MMKARAGRIINISSVVAHMGNPGQANYVAAKAGLIGLTKSIAMEIASRNITVNAVAPGFVESPMTDVLPDKVKEELKTRIPLGRMGIGRDVAAAIVFLASDEAGLYHRSCAGCERGDVFGVGQESEIGPTLKKQFPMLTLPLRLTRMARLPSKVKKL